MDIHIDTSGDIFHLGEQCGIDIGKCDTMIITLIPVSDSSPGVSVSFNGKMMGSNGGGVFISADKKNQIFGLGDIVNILDAGGLSSVKLEIHSMGRGVQIKGEIPRGAELESLIKNWKDSGILYRPVMPIVQLKRKTAENVTSGLKIRQIPHAPSPKP